VILAEPNAAHEPHERSQEIMDKYGILERGMELADVTQYAAGSSFTFVDQVIPLRVSHHERWRRIANRFVLSHNSFVHNLFVINRTQRPPKSLYQKFRTVARRLMCGDFP